MRKISPLSSAAITTLYFPYIVKGKEITDIKIVPIDSPLEIINAMANPYVDIIGHINQYTPDNFDWAPIIRNAKKTNTIIEVNMNFFPDPNILALIARENVPITLGLDFHSFAGLEINKSKIDMGDETDFYYSPKLSILKQHVRKMRLLKQAGIELSQVINLKDFDKFIALFRIEKYEREYC